MVLNPAALALTITSFQRSTTGSLDRRNRKDREGRRRYEKVKRQGVNMKARY